MTDEYDRIPQSTRDSLDRYAQQRIPVGDFLTAVLSNNLFGACAYADQHNIVALGQIVKYIYNHLPSGCHGSADNVAKWLNATK